MASGALRSIATGVVSCRCGHVDGWVTVYRHTVDAPDADAPSSEDRSDGNE